MRMRVGVAGLGAATGGGGGGGGGGAALGIPPRTPPSTPPGSPPGTPPTTPDTSDGGGSACTSLMLAISFGITLGAIKRLRSNFRGVWVALATRACAGGGGGGGGGGGSGANSTLLNCVSGSDSTKKSGIASNTPIANSCPAKASNTVHDRRVLAFETKDCSNMRHPSRNFSGFVQTLKELCLFDAPDPPTVHTVATVWLLLKFPCRSRTVVVRL
jgi:hypothetical protein